MHKGWHRREGLAIVLEELFFPIVIGHKKPSTLMRGTELVAMNLKDVNRNCPHTSADLNVAASTIPYSTMTKNTKTIEMLRKISRESAAPK